MIVACIFLNGFAQIKLLTNITSRKTTSLDGRWQYIVDPYETGFYNYRFKERGENDRDAYWNSDVPDNKTDRKEHGYSDKYVLKVPGDWNSQEEKFLYYEGTVWYKKSFDYQKLNASDKVFLYFGAVNYKADVYLNGKKLGQHKGGFTSFNFEIPDNVLKEKGNFLVVKVDNKRFADEIPTVNTDWWNYGGITRSVTLVEVPSSYVQDYSIQLSKIIPKNKSREITGWVKLEGAKDGESLTIEIPELKVKKIFPTISGLAKFNFQVRNPLGSMTCRSANSSQSQTQFLSVRRRRMIALHS